jgi:hypothetical protein
VTEETFAKWKKTRMDKKVAEEEAIKKSKEVQASAGKRYGASSFLFSFVIGLSA